MSLLLVTWTYNFIVSLLQFALRCPGWHYDQFVKVAEDRILIIMYLCKKICTNPGRLKPKMCEILMKMSKNILGLSASIIARDLYPLARTFLCISKIGCLSAASHVNVHVGRHFWHDRLKCFRYLLTENWAFVINTGSGKKVWDNKKKSLLHVVSYYSQNAAKQCI